MMATATEIGRHVIGLPEAQKDSAMVELKRSDPLLHALVKNYFKDCRNGTGRR